MLVVDDLLLFPVRGICWIFREIGQMAQDELSGEAESITEQLRMLYMQLETGRITEAEFTSEEKLLLDRLEAIESRLEDEDETDESDEEATEESDKSETRKSEETGCEPDELEESVY
jgi:hypothetical protein